MAMAEFSCASCAEAFATAGELRAHCKSERHVYNMKRQFFALKAGNRTSETFYCMGCMGAFWEVKGLSF